MDEKMLYDNSVNCIKACHRMLVVFLILIGFLITTFDSENKKLESDKKPKISAEEQVTLPIANIAISKSLAKKLPLPLAIGSLIGAIVAVFQLGETRGQLASDYNRLIRLYPSFLNANIWLRVIIGLGLCLLMIYALTLAVGDQENLIGFVLNISGMVLSLILGIVIVFWDR